MGEIAEKIDFAIEQDRVRPFLDWLAETKDEYAGIPMPIYGEKMVIHPKYRFAELLAKSSEPEEQLPADYEVVNSWWSERKKLTIVLYRDGGKLHWGIDPVVTHAEMQLHTMGCTQAWELEAELIALKKLRSLITEHQSHQYFMTGSFLETSKRSKITYFFRKLRPTIALTMHGEGVRILCTLCLHPIGYYAGTWAGAMVPTDEVIAHLMLMRGDEHDFWKQANQHPAHRRESGI